MGIEIPKTTHEYHSVIMDDQGDIYGVIAFNKGDNVKELVEDCILSVKGDFDSVQIPENVDFFGSSEISVEALLSSEGNAPEVFELSITQTGLTQRAAA